MDEISLEQKKLIQEIVENLVNGNYDAKPIVWKEGHRAEELKYAIDDYSEATGLKISTPPLEAYSMDFYVNSFTSKGKMVAMVSFPLWFGGQPSELCAEIDLERQEDGHWVSSLTDILVP